MEILSDFYLLDENNTPVTGINGNNTYQNRPETKAKADLERVIALNKPLPVISIFTEMYLLGLQWDWFEDYQKYASNLSSVNVFNANLPVISIDENGDDVFASSLDLPVEPMRPLKLTVDEFKTQDKTTFKNHSKLNAFEFNGVVCSACEQDQHGWTDLMLATQTAQSLGQEFKPIPFKNENGNVVILETREMWDNFYLAGWSARQRVF